MNRYPVLEQIFLQKSDEINIDLFTKDVFGKTAFDYKVENEDDEKVNNKEESTTEENDNIEYDIDYYDGKDGRKALYKAIQLDDPKLVERLIQKSAEFSIELNTKDERGKTAFYNSCMEGYLKITDMLIQKSAEFNIDVNAEEEDGLTPFHSGRSISR